MAIRRDNWDQHRCLGILIGSGLTVAKHRKIAIRNPMSRSDVTLTRGHAMRTSCILAVAVSTANRKRLPAAKAISV